MVGTRLLSQQNDLQRIKVGDRQTETERQRQRDRQRQRQTDRDSIRETEIERECNTANKVFREPKEKYNTEYRGFGKSAK